MTTLQEIQAEDRISKKKILMCKEDYVTFEVAKLLKEKGFREICNKCYGIESKKFFSDIRSNDDDTMYAAPTLQMAMKWLRKVHHYYIQVMLDNWVGTHVGYYVIINKTDSDFGLQLYDEEEQVFYETPEEACEAAIKYVLENLI